MSKSINEVIETLQSILTYLNKNTHTDKNSVFHLTDTPKNIDNVNSVSTFERLLAQISIDNSIRTYNIALTVINMMTSMLQNVKIPHLERLLKRLIHSVDAIEMSKDNAILDRSIRNDTKIKTDSRGRFIGSNSTGLSKSEMELIKNLNKSVAANRMKDKILTKHSVVYKSYKKVANRIARELMGIDQEGEKELIERYKGKKLPYVPDNLEIRKVKNFDGEGVFAKVTIAKGENIGLYCGDLSFIVNTDAVDTEYVYTVEPEFEDSNGNLISQAVAIDARETWTGKINHKWTYPNPRYTNPDLRMGTTTIHENIKDIMVGVSSLLHTGADPLSIFKDPDNEKRNSPTVSDEMDDFIVDFDEFNEEIINLIREINLKAISDENFEIPDKRYQGAFANCYLDGEGNIIAIREIEPNEELAIDYSIDYWKERRRPFWDISSFDLDFIKKMGDFFLLYYSLSVTKPPITLMPFFKEKFDVISPLVPFDLNIYFNVREIHALGDRANRLEIDNLENIDNKKKKKDDNNNNNGDDNEDDDEDDANLNDTENSTLLDESDRVYESLAKVNVTDMNKLYKSLKKLMGDIEREGNIVDTKITQISEWMNILTYYYVNFIPRPDMPRSALIPYIYKASNRVDSNLIVPMMEIINDTINTQIPISILPPQSYPLITILELMKDLIKHLNPPNSVNELQTSFQQKIDVLMEAETDFIRIQDSIDEETREPQKAKLKKNLIEKISEIKTAKDLIYSFFATNVNGFFERYKSYITSCEARNQGSNRNTDEVYGNPNDEPPRVILERQALVLNSEETDDLQQSSYILRIFKLAQTITQILQTFANYFIDVVRSAVENRFETIRKLMEDPLNKNRIDEKIVNEFYFTLTREDLSDMNEINRNIATRLPHLFYITLERSSLVSILMNCGQVLKLIQEKSLFHIKTNYELWAYFMLEYIPTNKIGRAGNLIPVSALSSSSGHKNRVPNGNLNSLNDPNLRTTITTPRESTPVTTTTISTAPTTPTASTTNTTTTATTATTTPSNPAQNGATPTVLIPKRKQPTRAPTFKTKISSPLLVGVKPESNSDIDNESTTPKHTTIPLTSLSVYDDLITIKGVYARMTEGLFMVTEKINQLLIMKNFSYDQSITISGSDAQYISGKGDPKKISDVIAKLFKNRRIQLTHPFAMCIKTDTTEAIIHALAKLYKDNLITVKEGSESDSDKVEREEWLHLIEYVYLLIWSISRSKDLNKVRINNETVNISRILANGTLKINPKRNVFSYYKKYNKMLSSNKMFLNVDRCMTIIFSRLIYLIHLIFSFDTIKLRNYDMLSMIFDNSETNFTYTVEWFEQQGDIRNVNEYMEAISRFSSLEYIIQMNPEDNPKEFLTKERYITSELMEEARLFLLNIKPEDRN